MSGVRVEVLSTTGDLHAFTVPDRPVPDHVVERLDRLIDELREDGHPEPVWLLVAEVAMRRIDRAGWARECQRRGVLL